MVRLRKVGGSVMLPVPAALLTLARLAPGSTVDLTIRGDVLQVKAARPRYTMDELLASSDYSQIRADREWLDAPAAGRELP
jgi:antitoxin ChpS